MIIKLSSYLLNPTDSVNSGSINGIIFVIIICIIVIAPSAHALIHLLLPFLLVTADSDTFARVSLVTLLITLVVPAVA